MLADGDGDGAARGDHARRAVVGKHLSREKSNGASRTACAWPTSCWRWTWPAPHSWAGGATGAGRRWVTCTCGRTCRRGDRPGLAGHDQFLGPVHRSGRRPATGVSPLAAASPDRPPRRGRLRGALRLRGRVLRRGGIDRRPGDEGSRAHPARRRPPQNAVPHPTVARIPAVDAVGDPTPGADGDRGRRSTTRRRRASSSSTWRPPTRLRRRIGRCGPKRALRDAAYEHERAVTFMARPFPVYGSGLHLHLPVARRRTRVRRRRRSVALLGRRNAGHGGGGDVDLCPDDQFVPPPGRLRRRADHPTWGEDNKAAVRTIT